MGSIAWYGNDSLKAGQLDRRSTATKGMNRVKADVGRLMQSERGEPLGTATTLSAVDQDVHHEPGHPSAVILPLPAV